MSNSESSDNVDSGRRGVGVKLASERGTTLTSVKVPKVALSVNGQKVSASRDSGEVGLEAAFL